MTFLPIVDRELRVASRQRTTYWSRFSAALVTVVVTGWILLVMRDAASALISKSLFGTQAGILFLYCLFAGIWQTSDCISEEKREGTLGLLFLTDLRGHDVILGKLVSTSVRSLYAMLAVLPVMAIPFFLGGLTGGEFFRVVLVLLNTLFFSLSVGILCSTMFYQAQRAMTGSMLLVLVITGGLPLIAAYLRAEFRAPIAEFLLLPSSGFAMTLAMDSGYTGRPVPFWISTGLTHAFGWICLIGAAVIAPRAWQDRPAGGRRVRFRERLTRWSQGSAESRAIYRKKLLSINPVFWLTARDRLKPVYVWVLLGLLGIVWSWCAVRFDRSWFLEPTYILTAFLLNTILKMWIASESCRRFLEDRKSGAMELLLSAPLKVSELIQGQLRALLRQFGGPTAAVVAVDILLMVAPAWGRSTRVDDFWVWIFLAAIAMLIADMITIAWLGMWIGLTATKANKASGAIVSRVMALPWAIFMVGVTSLGILFSLLRWTPPSLPDPEYVFLGAWFGISLLNDLIWIAWSGERLYGQFRERATQRAAPAKRRWFGGKSQSK